MGLVYKLLLTGDFRYLVMILLGILPCIAIITLFSVVRSRVLYRLGDPIPKLNGGFRWHPVHHVHLVGLILLVTTGLGWGTWPEYRKSNLKKPILHSLLAFLAGWGSCLAVSLLCFALFALAYRQGDLSLGRIWLAWVLGFTGVMGVSYGLFLLLPLPGFLGYLFLCGHFPENIVTGLEKISRQVVLLYSVLLWTGLLHPGLTGLVGGLLHPVCAVMGIDFTVIQSFYL